VPLDPCRFEQLGEHFDRALGENKSVPLMGLKEQVVCHCTQFVFTLPSLEWIKAVAYPPGVEDVHVAHRGLEPCGLLEEIALDVVDYDGSSQSLPRNLR